MLCRNCHQETGDDVLVDLGMQPLANSLMSTYRLTNGPEESTYRLAPVICKNKMCRLIQLPELPDGVGFGADYPYRSGQSESWKLHLRDLVECSGVRAGDHVLDVGGNDGTLAHLLPAGALYTNVDPTVTENTAKRGLFLRGYMGRKVAMHPVLTGACDYVFALNVAAHVPDLDDFFAGIYACLNDTGKLIVEVQDVNQLIERGEWDCIYHEHYSYFNKGTLADAIERRGFYVEKYEDIPTHGGSIRLTARKIEKRLLDHPLHRQPLRLPKPYPKWPQRDHLVLAGSQIKGWMGHRRVVGYGAPAKAMTFLNQQGFTSRHIDYIVDSTPEKQGKYTPASHIEIKSPDVLDTDTPDIIVVLAWNWLSEILPKIPESVPEVWCRGERLR